MNPRKLLAGRVPIAFVAPASRRRSGGRLARPIGTAGLPSGDALLRTRSSLRRRRGEGCSRVRRKAANLPRLAGFPRPPGSGRGRRPPGRGSCSRPQGSARLRVEVPWPGRRSTAGRNKCAAPMTFAAVGCRPFARTYTPRQIYVRLRSRDCSAGKTSFPKHPFLVVEEKYCLASWRGASR